MRSWSLVLSWSVGELGGSDSDLGTDVIGVEGIDMPNGP